MDEMKLFIESLKEENPYRFIAINSNEIKNTIQRNVNNEINRYWIGYVLAANLKDEESFIPEISKSIATRGRYIRWTRALRTVAEINVEIAKEIYEGRRQMTHTDVSLLYSRLKNYPLNKAETIAEVIKIKKGNHSISIKQNPNFKNPYDSHLDSLTLTIKEWKRVISINMKEIEFSKCSSDSYWKFQGELMKIINLLSSFYKEEE